MASRPTIRRSAFGLLSGAGVLMLSEGMAVTEELASRIKFAKQKSKLAGTIRASYFAFKNEN
jgi:hypothetical protein